MNVTEKTESCAHTPCNCDAKEQGGYCSEHCRNASGGIETKCGCGHPDCN